MGILKAAGMAIGGALADQWLEATGLSQSQDDTLLRCVETLRDSTLQQDVPKKQKSPRRSSMTR